ncbi:hypothetical protein NECAME_04773 [Necator americanus]|uniref:Phospholipase A2 n=1 Tax=Necator americanus TaxID=51031 RepID=W2SQF3_NECAM|nr:hypothetical protein NECAME_04773 [Necator americanus]ETN70922.1 hypothetical protein NECAME_04773 [Necator americanus]
MQPYLVVVFVNLLSIRGTSAYSMKDMRIGLKEWTCGFDIEQIEESYGLLKDGCEQYIPEINMCCAQHKDCYQQKRGYRPCDVHLCNCVQFPWSSDHNTMTIQADRSQE